MKIRQELKGMEKEDCQRDLDILGDTMSLVTGTPKEIILSRNREYPLPYLRFMIFRVLRSRGYSYNTIGRAIGMGHCNVIRGVNLISNIVNYPSGWDDITRIWNKFNNALSPDYQI